MLYAFIAEARRRRASSISSPVRPLPKSSKEGDKVTGVDLEKDGAKKSVASKVLVEATEYGDILPLAGARYRAGTVTSENLRAGFARAVRHLSRRHPRVSRGFARASENQGSASRIRGEPLQKIATLRKVDLGFTRQGLQGAAAVSCAPRVARHGGCG